MDFNLIVAVVLVLITIYLMFVIHKRDKEVTNLNFQLQSKEADITEFSNQLTNCKRSEKACQQGQQTLSEEIELQKGLVKDRDKRIVNIEAKDLLKTEIKELLI